MKTVMASDHRGIALKDKIREIFSTRGWMLSDLGPKTEESVDYPDFALKACQEVVRGEAGRGILICGTGIGMSIAANKIPGIRAALCYNPEVALMARKHNDANVLVLSADYTDETTLALLLENFFTTDFEGGRHQRRVDKVSHLEKQA
ncbi:ribose 5-phosphate isomerase B [Candidatus Mcinerneyibacteriota bacterium]|nr:ribose 5-phosphate isomerase B [Candidatus Mcinerneyibacteriota bacterium]